MFKGSNRKMFRKPGMARRAIGILASSPEIMQAANRNMPVRMAPGGLMDRDLFQQAQERARYMRSRPGVSYNMSEDEMVQGIYQSLLDRKQAASMNRADQLKAAGQKFISENPADVTQLGAFSLDTSPFARNKAGLPTRTPTDVSDMTMQQLYDLRRELGRTGFGFSPLEKEGLEQSRKRVEDAIVKGRQTRKDAKKTLKSIGLDDIEVTKSPDDVSVEDVVSPNREGRSESVSSIRPFGYDPSGLLDKSILTPKTKERRSQILKVLEKDKEARPGAQLSEERKGELEAELQELNRLDLGQDKLFRDMGIPEYSARNYRDNENQIKNLDKMIKRQEERRDRGIETENDKLITSSNEEISRLTNVRDRALTDRQFMTADYYKSQGQEVTEELLRLGVPDQKKKEGTLTEEDKQLKAAEDNNKQVAVIDDINKDLIDPNKKLDNVEDVNNLTADDITVSNNRPESSSGRGVTSITEITDLINNTDEEVSDSDKENAKEILREQGQPPELADRPDFWHYVTLAGLGIAAGESDNALTNIAKGLLMGLDQKAKDDKDYRKEGYERWLANTKLDINKQQLVLEEKALELREKGLRLKEDFDYRRPTDRATAVSEFRETFGVTPGTAQLLFSLKDRDEFDDSIKDDLKNQGRTYNSQEELIAAGEKGDLVGVPYVVIPKPNPKGGTTDELVPVSKGYFQPTKKKTTN